MRRLLFATSLVLGLPLLLAGTTSVVTAATAASTYGVSFIHDDYAKALQQARAQKLPLFAKIWSPW
ncbi:MAG: hypothetical protein U0V87_02310 [Acidobacteriota bacterium]